MLITSYIMKTIQHTLNHTSEFAFLATYVHLKNIPITNNNLFKPFPYVTDTPPKSGCSISKFFKQRCMTASELCLKEELTYWY